MNVLIAHASKYGSTAEVAESIAATLRGQCVNVDVRPTGEVTSLEGYDGVVLGGGIYMGRWHRGARRFARDFDPELGRLPVAVFALGPVDEVAEHHASSRRQFDHALGKLGFQPFATALFGGVVDPHRLAFPFNRMPAADARDWETIRGWSIGVADGFLSSATPRAA